MMPCRPMHVTQGPDFSTEREFGLVGECWQEDDLDEGEERNYHWIWITQDYEALSSYHVEEQKLHFARLCFLRARQR